MSPISAIALERTDTLIKFFIHSFIQTSLQHLMEVHCIQVMYVMWPDQKESSSLCIMHYFEQSQMLNKMRTAQMWYYLWIQEVGVHDGPFDVKDICVVFQGLQVKADNNILHSPLGWYIVCSKVNKSSKHILFLSWNVMQVADIIFEKCRCSLQGSCQTHNHNLHGNITWRNHFNLGRDNFGSLTEGLIKHLCTSVAACPKLSPESEKCMYNKRYTYCTQAEYSPSEGVQHSHTAVQCVHDHNGWTSGSLELHLQPVQWSIQTNNSSPREISCSLLYSNQSIRRGTKHKNTYKTNKYNIYRVSNIVHHSTDLGSSHQVHLQQSSLQVGFTWSVVLECIQQEWGAGLYLVGFHEHIYNLEALNKIDYSPHVWPRGA